MRDRSLPVVVALMTTALALAWPPTALQGGQSFQDKIAGTWESARSKKEARARLNKKVEHIVDQMSFYKRPFARGQLRSATEPAERLDISFDGEKVRVQFDDDNPAISNKDGTPGKWTNDEGEVHKLTQKVGSDRIVQSFSNDEGTRTNTLRLEDDDTLVLEVEITSSQMPEPLTYQRKFDRK